MKSLKSLIIEQNEPFEVPTTGWAAPETPKDKLLELIPKSSLTEKERVVIMERLNNFTLEEIGKKYGVTRAAIENILKRAILKIRKAAMREKTIG